MDRDRFDALTKSFVSRRAGLAFGLAALLGVGAATDADAKKPKPCGPCKRRKNGVCKPKPNGAACGGNRVCRGGTCSACAPGLIRCGSVCVRAASDPANCGGCGARCGATQLCLGGACVAGIGSCPAGGNVCANPITQALFRCNGDHRCACYLNQAGSTRCAATYTTGKAERFPCTSDADCASIGPTAFCPQRGERCTTAVCAIACPTAD